MVVRSRDIRGSRGVAEASVFANFEPEIFA